MQAIRIGEYDFAIKENPQKKIFGLNPNPESQFRFAQSSCN
jgi:hypothetical protein